MMYGSFLNSDFDFRYSFLHERILGSLGSLPAYFQDLGGFIKQGRTWASERLLCRPRYFLKSRPKHKPAYYVPWFLQVEVLVKRFVARLGRLLFGPAAVFTHYLALSLATLLIVSPL